jgi:hypothetical protein
VKDVARRQQESQEANGGFAPDCVEKLSLEVASIN